jgi:predicted DCC family thiol-disulfide oxidoreductase YuxK
MKSNAKTKKTEIFYNGSCSICAPEIHLYKKIITNENVEGDSQLDFVDISVSAPDEFSQEDMLKRLHAKLPNGDIVSGVPAFITLWKQVPGFKGLAFLINLPIIKSVAVFIYDKILAPTLYKRYIRSVKNQNQCDT